MWPWILQDWEGSSGSFYDQPAAWTGSGGTWLVWDFFLILEGIRVLLCPWLRSIGGIRDSSYSDLSQYETRVMAQMVESTCIAGDLVQSLGWEDPLENTGKYHSSILAWRISMDSGAWQAACSPWGRKESDTTEKLNTMQRLGFVTDLIPCIRRGLAEPSVVTRSWDGRDSRTSFLSFSGGLHPQVRSTLQIHSSGT